jgi:hypothetical protein
MTLVPLLRRLNGIAFPYLAERITCIAPQSGTRLALQGVPQNCLLAYTRASTHINFGVVGNVRNGCFDQQHGVSRGFHLVDTGANAHRLRCPTPKLMCVEAPGLA